MQQNRASLNTYENAIWRIVQYVVQETHGEAEIRLAVQIVADIYWCSDAKVEHDVNNAARGLGFVPSTPPKFASVRDLMVS
ncbi:hypothetical protein KUV28_00560 [Ferrimonas balearica]|nr:hypothetical protein [Ferrimonas balearica]